MSKPVMLSMTEMLDKYHESKVEESLHLFMKLESVADYCKRRTETYKDRITRRKVLERHFFKQEDGSEKMTITVLIHNDIKYMAKRSS